MAGVLRNEFSVSLSTASDFREGCRRAHWWRKFGSWEGWKSTAPPDTRLAYRLKKLETLPTLKGSIVHEQIAGVLSSSLLKFTPSTVRKAVLARIEGAQLFHTEYPKAPGQLKIAGAFSPKDMAKDIMSILTRLLGSDTWKSILKLPGTRKVEELASFNLLTEDEEVFKVWVKLDLSIHNGSTVYIFDWKTGKRGNVDPFQMAVYALAMEEIYGVVDADVTLVYLSPDSEPVAENLPPVTPKAKQDVIAYFQETVERMRDLLERRDMGRNSPLSIEEYPKAGESPADGPCRWCPYQKLCWKEEYA